MIGVKESSLTLRLMGDLKKASAISLPPGFRFRPSEEQLLSYYLSEKNKNQNHNLSNPSPHDPLYSFDVIPEIDLYNYHPCDLPETACFLFGHGGSKKHWYCFTVKVATKRSKRKSEGGFWKTKGRPRDVVCGNEGTVLGTRTTFVFYSGNSSCFSETDWVMNEYALVDYLKDSFVLCRVFKSHDGKKRSENVPSSYAEENDATTLDICMDAPYKQHNGASTSGIGEVAVHENTLVDTDNEIQMFPLTGAPDDLVAGPVSDDGFGSPQGIPQPDQLVKPSDEFMSGSVLFDYAVADELIINSSILEGDFIELNDLFYRHFGLVDHREIPLLL